MAIEIIKRGTPPGERRYTATCRNCSTEFSFLPHDATKQFDQRDGDYFVISCPVCTKDCTVAERVAFPPRRG